MQSSASSHLSSTSGTGKVKSEVPESEELSVPPIRTLPRQMEQKEARPNVDYQDKLWSQIDVLDDVRRMAREQDTYEGFPPAFESELHKLRETHVTLLQTMKKRRDEQNEDRGTIDNNEEERKLVNDLMNSLEGLKDWHG